jgi:RNA polymerase sigma-70 factor (ECF subfamily)
MAQLKPAQAEAIRLVKLEGYSVEEASRATGQSISLIKVNIHRGLRQLANIIKRVGDAD